MEVPTRGAGRRPTWRYAGVSTLRDWAELPADAGVAGVAPGSVTDPPRVPAEVPRVPQLWNHIGREPVVVGKLEEKVEKLRRDGLVSKLTHLLGL